MASSGTPPPPRKEYLHKKAQPKEWDLQNIYDSVIGVFRDTGKSWFNFGLALGVPKEKLNSINNGSDNSHCLHETLSYWLSDSSQSAKTQEELVELAKEVTRQGFPHNLKWTLSDKPAPQKMSYPIDAVAHNGVAYFRPYRSRKVYSYNSTAESWATLPECIVKDTTLVIIPNEEGSVDLHTIGGIKETTDHQSENEIRTGRLYQLQQKQGEESKWIESSYNRMKTKRSLVAAVCTEKWLIVTGGRTDHGPTATVEVLTIDTNEWVTVADLPRPLFRASGCLCKGYLYILGGYEVDMNGHFNPVTSAFKASIADIVKPHASETQVFHEIASLPLYNPACLSAHGRILAIGGSTHNQEVHAERKCSNLVHVYSPGKTWQTVANSLEKQRTRCFAAALPSQLMVVGGYTISTDVGCTDSVEFADIDIIA